MDKHRSNVFIALVLVLLIIAAILAWTTGSKILSGAPVTANDNAKPVSTKVVPSAAVETSSPSKTPAETSTPEPTATPKPSATPKPTATPKPEARTLDKTGSISSQTGANINMRVDWHITSANSKELTLDVEVYIVSYAINAGQHNGSIRLYGKEYTFVSDPIRIMITRKSTKRSSMTPPSPSPPRPARPWPCQFRRSGILTACTAASR